MGAKKKAGGDKKKKEGDEEDQSMENFLKFIKKKWVEFMPEGTKMSKIILSYKEKFEEDGDEMKKLHMWEELGWPGVKAITEALKMAA